ncbi:MAG: hypothetical protein ACR2J5_09400 [Geodermatophilaceae bacterium]
MNQPIVHTAAEKRPYPSIPHMLPLVDRSADYGFPSDHAVMAGAVAIAAAVLDWHLRPRRSVPPSPAIEFVGRATLIRLHRVLVCTDVDP